MFWIAVELTCIHLQLSVLHSFIPDCSVESSLQEKMISAAPTSSASIKQEPEDEVKEEHLDLGKFHLEPHFVFHSPALFPSLSVSPNTADDDYRTTQFLIPFKITSIPCMQCILRCPYRTHHCNMYESLNWLNHSNLEGIHTGCNLISNVFPSRFY